MRFDVYLESGPQHKRTWVFVPALAGCSTVAPVSEQASEAAADAIRERLAFLRERGETMLPVAGDGIVPIASAEPLDLVVAQHVIERKILGFGQQFWEPDLVPLGADEAARLLRWAGWSREAFIAAARAQARPLGEKPDAGRSTGTILSHVAESEWAYVSATLGTVKGGGPIMAAIAAGGPDVWDALDAERGVLAARLAELTDEERSRIVEKNGLPRWTARRMFRRLLEHEWEHTRELRARI